MKQKIKDKIAQWLGLPTQGDIKKISEGVNLLIEQNKDLQEQFDTVKGQFNTLKSDMRALYGEVASDIKRVDKKIKAVKPILKVEDEEAVAFIKGILSKHDRHMNINQESLQSSMREFNSLNKQAALAVEKANKATQTVNNIFNGLGLTEATPDLQVFEAVKTIIVEAKKKGVEVAQQA